MTPPKIEAVRSDCNQTDTHLNNKEQLLCRCNLDIRYFTIVCKKKSNEMTEGNHLIEDIFTIESLIFLRLLHFKMCLNLRRHCCCLDSLLNDASHQHQLVCGLSITQKRHTPILCTCVCACVSFKKSNSPTSLTKVMESFWAPYMYSTHHRHPSNYHSQISTAAMLSKQSLVCVSNIPGGM